MQVVGTGRAVLPRYGNGWMHQFGYVYSLQHEMLNPDLNNWYRALELMHAARAEGVAMNVSHYNQILRTFVRPGKWDEAVKILDQMRREGIRPDVVGVGSALSACANEGRAKEAQEIFDFYFGKRQMKPDSHCFHALMVAKKKAGGEGGSLDGLLGVTAVQQREGIPLSQPQFVALLESCEAEEDREKAMAVVEIMRGQKMAVPERALPLLERMRVDPPRYDASALVAADAEGGFSQQSRLPSSSSHSSTPRIGSDPFKLPFVGQSRSKRHLL